MASWIALLLLGASPPTEPTAPSAATQAETGDGAPRPFTCCDSRRVTSIVERYVAIVDALAADRARAQAEVFALRSYLDPDPSLPPAENDVIRDLYQRVFALQNGSLDRVRDELAPISHGVIFLALRHEGGDDLVVEATCPGVGSWLQSETDAPRSPWRTSCAQWR